MEKEPMAKTETCPQCKGTGDAYKYKYRGYKKYWFPCPVCRGGKKEPNMKRYQEWLKEDNIHPPKPKPKKKGKEDVSDG
jgi:hypothetical protein